MSLPHAPCSGGQDSPGFGNLPWLTSQPPTLPRIHATHAHMTYAPAHTLHRTAVTFARSCSHSISLFLLSSRTCLTHEETGSGIPVMLEATDSAYYHTFAAHIRAHALLPHCTLHASPTLPARLPHAHSGGGTGCPLSLSLLISLLSLLSVVFFSLTTAALPLTSLHML